MADKLCRMSRGHVLGVLPAGWPHERAPGGGGGRVHDQRGVRQGCGPPHLRVQHRPPAGRHGAPAHARRCMHSCLASVPAAALASMRCTWAPNILLVNAVRSSMVLQGRPLGASRDWLAAAASMRPAGVWMPQWILYPLCPALRLTLASSPRQLAHAGTAPRCPGLDSPPTLRSAAGWRARLHTSGDVHRWQR